MKLTWFGHSAFRLDLDGAGILIDPFLTGNPSFTGDRAAAVAGATHIVLTHGHGDHVGDTLAIAQETGATVFANYEICVWLAGQGLASYEPMNTGGTVDAGPFSVTLVRADHSSAVVESGANVPLGSANGVVIKAPGLPTLYHMGDTDIFGDMDLIAELHQPRIGIVPIGDRFTMGPDVAAMAVKRYFAFDAVIPCHYATFGLLVPNADRFVAAMAGHPTRVIVPQKNVAVGLPWPS